MPVKKRGKAAKSHKKIPAAQKRTEQQYRTETMMAKMVFSADLFEDEAAVESWIKDAEWEADKIDITKNGDGDWEARANGLTDEDFERLAPVDADDEGVSAFVGERKVAINDDEEDEDEAETEAKSDDTDEEEDEAETEAKSDEDDDEDEVEASADDEEKKGTGKKPRKYSKRQEFLAKRKEKASKFDAWDAMFSEGNELASVIKQGMDWDGIPPGVNEVQLAFNVTIGNILGSEGMPADDKQEALNKAATDFAEIVGGLDSFFASYVEDPEAMEARAPVEKRDRLAKWAEMFADWLNESDPDKEEASDDDDDAEKAEKKSVKKASEPLTIDYNKISETVADLVAKAVEPLAKEVETVSGTVESIASRRPSKKAVASDDSGTAAPTTEKISKADDDADYLRRKQVKGIFG